MHLHLVILARQICEGIYDAKVEETDHDKKEVENENKTGASETPHYDSTVKKLMSNTIPYNIPPNVVRLSDQMVVPEQERLVFESKEFTKVNLVNPCIHKDVTQSMEMEF